MAPGGVTLRTPAPTYSAIQSLPPASASTPSPPHSAPSGAASAGAAAGSPSTGIGGDPVPATVEIEPEFDILRTRWFRSSAMYTFPAPSTPTPLGPLSTAAVAGPPSPR